MTKQTTDEKPTKPKKKLLITLIGGLTLIGVGSGGAYWLIRSGVFGTGLAKPKEIDNPKLIRKGEEDPYAPKAEGEKEGGAPEGSEGDGGSEFRTTYFTFSEEMTSNLLNSDSLAQISLAASTRRNGRVLLWLKKHELAIRSKLLIEIANTSEEQLRTPAGKEHLQTRMTAAINKVLIQNEGFGGVDAVFFRSILVQ